MSVVNKFHLIFYIAEVFHATAFIGRFISHDDHLRAPAQHAVEAEIFGIAAINQVHIGRTRIVVIEGSKQRRCIVERPRECLLPARIFRFRMDISNCHAPVLIRAKQRCGNAHARDWIAIRKLLRIQKRGGAEDPVGERMTRVVILFRVNLVKSVLARAQTIDAQFKYLLRRRVKCRTRPTPKKAALGSARIGQPVRNVGVTLVERIQFRRRIFFAMIGLRLRAMLLSVGTVFRVVEPISAQNSVAVTPRRGRQRELQIKQPVRGVVHWQ